MTKMRAMAAVAPGEKLELQTREIPTPGAREVLVRVQACGVCHGDSVTVEGHAPGIQYPRVPGHEVVGTIEAIGPEVHGWEVGSRVGAGWFPGSCGYCAACRRDNAFSCLNVRGAHGITRDGGYATHMVADISALARIPASLNAVDAAPLLCAGATTFNALRNSDARPGEIVAIHGIGGLGHLGIQFAARLGFHTVAINRGSEKKAMAHSLGADEYIDSSATDPAQALSAMGGAKVILSTVTDAKAMEAVLGGLGVNGMLIIVGGVGPITINPLDFIDKRAGVRGWYCGVGVDFEDTLSFSLDNDIRSMNEVFAFDEAQQAYDRMMSGNARYRVVLNMADQE